MENWSKANFLDSISEINKICTIVLVLANRKATIGVRYVYSSPFAFAYLKENRRTAIPIIIRMIAAMKLPLYASALVKP